MVDPTLDALRRLTGRPEAEFHEHQREAIDALVSKRSRVLLVQRTGWGKSAVYFLATSLLREQGYGPTLLISPLLALMRNQIDAASRVGLRSMTVNSASTTTVDDLAQRLDEDVVDLVLVSPERLANPEFGDQIMPIIGSRPGLIVIDEVHCVSDWGHDFRPDYRRIVGLLDRLVGTVPVLGCTATANDRVVVDAATQLGAEFTTFRGPLRRDGLALAVLELPHPSDRLAWLATNLEALPGSGIIYCLTVADVFAVHDWLRGHGSNVLAYTGDTDGDARVVAEHLLQSNEVKALVATTALGMGYDKPDLGFVVHYQSPGSPVGYYQQVGRAGRALTASVAVLLVGNEDRAIQDYFIERAFPIAEQVDEVLGVLDRYGGPVTVSLAEEHVNLRRTDIVLILKQLDVEGVVRRVGGLRFERTLKEWAYPTDRVERVTAARRDEQRQMLGYIDTATCRMVYLTQLLDDHTGASCGICDRCTGAKVGRGTTIELRVQAERFLRRRPLIIEPRHHGVPKEHRCEPGRALARWGSGGWGPMIQAGKHSGEFDDQLVDALADLVAEWSPAPAPEWVTAVPSLRHPRLVDSLARRLADRLRLPYRPVVRKLDERPPQKTRANGAQQRANVRDAFAIEGEVLGAAVVLVDDLVDSRWTFTEVGKALRAHGAGPVYPVALASTAGRS